MRPTNAQVRVPYLFAIALAVIAVIANLVGYAQTGNPAVALLPFLCFFPMVFFFAVNVQRQTIDYIALLEERVRQLEGKAEAV